MKTFLALTTGFLGGMMSMFTITCITMAKYGIRFEIEKEEKEVTTEDE